MANQNASRRAVAGEKGGRLIQTRVGPSVEKGLDDLAEAAFMTRAAYVRKVLTEHVLIKR